MGIICKEEEVDGRKNKKDINKRKTDTQNEITKIELDIELLTREVNELNEKLKSTDGNMNKAEREHLENDLYEKIEELEELHLNKRALNTDLKELRRGERNKNVENAMKRNGKYLDKNQPDNLFIDKRYELLNKIKAENELRKQKMKEGQNMLNGNKSKFEKRDKINKFFNNNQ